MQGTSLDKALKFAIISKYFDTIDLDISNPVEERFLAPLDFLKVLAHDLRWELVTALAQSDYRVHELSVQLGQPQNLVSYHLKQLRDANLIHEHRSTADARDIYYSLDLSRVHIAYQGLGSALHPALSFERLEQPAHNASKPGASVLFLCTENSARSQLAEGLLRHMGGSNLIVASAGTAPSAVHPLAVYTLNSRGIDIRAQYAKSVDAFHGQAFDYVITVCDRARENCPTFAAGTVLIHWSLPDPAAIKDEAAQVEAFRQTAIALEHRIVYLLMMIHTRNGANR